MNVISQQIRKGGLSMYGLVDWLAGQRSAITSAAPSRLATAMGLDSLSNLGARTASFARDAAAAARPTRRWPLALALLALVLFGIVALMRANRVRPDVTAHIPTVGDVQQAAADLGAWTMRMLPGDVQLRVPENGIESRVIAFIQDAGRPTDATSWFNFDRLLFDSGSTTLRPESQEQLRNIAAILKAYPAVKIKVGAYTDNTGDDASNMKLSEERAQSVRSQLIDLGVSGDRIAAEGYGSTHPVADNATESGRAANRRVAMLVVDK
jgi:outer membrane protein OmpA-like peptidoglycan-associated protein